MGFGQPLDAGGNITRDFFRSPNYVAGASGWTVNRDGTAEFQSVVVRGSITADDFRSANYVPGTSGFDLNANTGVVEFNSTVTINGGTLNAGTINGATFNAGSVFANLIQSQNYVSQTSGYSFNGTTGNAQWNGTMDVYGNITMHSTSSNTGAVILIPLTPVGATLNEGALAALNLTSAGVAAEAPYLVSSSQGSAGNTSVILVTPGVTGNANHPTIYVGSNNATRGVLTDMSPLGGAFTDLVFPTMRHVEGAVAATSTTITSTSYVDFATLSVSFVAPQSGVVSVFCRALMQITNGSAALQRCLQAFVVRNTNGSGTLFRAATDREAVDYGVPAGLSGRLQAESSGVVTGLVPGNTYAVNMAVRTTDAGGTTSVSLFDANFIIIPSP